jgi:hypothetical protein
VALFKVSIPENILEVQAIGIRNLSNQNKEHIKFPESILALTKVLPTDGVCWDMTKICTMQTVYYMALAKHIVTHVELGPISMSITNMKKNETHNRDKIKSVYEQLI